PCYEWSTKLHPLRAIIPATPWCYRLSNPIAVPFQFGSLQTAVSKAIRRSGPHYYPAGPRRLASDTALTFFVHDTVFGAESVHLSPTTKRPSEIPIFPKRLFER